MRANRILKRKLAREKAKLAKRHIKEKLLAYREEHNHLLMPPSRHNFSKEGHSKLLAQYNKDLLDYHGYKMLLYKELIGLTKT